MSENRPIDSSLAPRMQSSLGKSNFRRNMGALKDKGLAWGIVTKVDYTVGRAIVSVKDSNYAINANTTYGALIPVEFYNYDDTGRVYGQSRPLSTGSRVLIGYVNDSLQNPIILGVYPDDTSNMKQLSPASSPNDTDSNYATRERALTRKTVYPSQQVDIVTPSGDYMRTFNSESLVKVTNDDTVQNEDYDGSMDMLNRKQDGSGNRYQTDTVPQHMLLLHQGTINGSSHRTRLYIAKDGTLSGLWVDPKDSTKAVFFDFNKKTGIKFRFQQDSDKIDQIGSNKYTTITLSADNIARIIATDGGSTGSVEVTPTGTIIDGLKVASEQNFQTLSKYLKTIQDTVDTLNDTISKVGFNYIENLPDKINGLIRDISTNANAISDQVSKLDKNNKLVTDLSTKVDSIKSSTETGMSTLLDKINKLVDELTNYSSVESNVNKMNAIYDDTKNMLDEYPIDKQSFLTKDTDSITKINEDIETNSQSIKDTNGTISTLKSNNDTLSTNLKSLQDNYDSMNKLVTTLKSNNDTLSTNLKSLQDKYDSMKTLVTTLADKAGVKIPSGF